MNKLPIIVLLVSAIVLVGGFAITANGGDCRISGDGYGNCRMAAFASAETEEFAKASGCCHQEELAACDRSGKKECSRARKCEGKQDGECRKADSCKK